MTETLTGLADLNRKRLLRLCDSMRANGLGEYVSIAREVLSAARLGLPQRMGNKLWRVQDDGTLREEV